MCDAADLQNYLHASQPDSAASGLLASWAPLGSHTSSRFAWLSAAGLQHGRVRTDLEQRPSSDLEYLAMEPDSLALDDSREPIRHAVSCDCCLPTVCSGTQVVHASQFQEELLCVAQAMTEFHYLLLDQSSLRIYNRISGQLVQEIAISGPGGMLPSAQGASSVLLRDAEAAQVYVVVGECQVHATARIHSFRCMAG